MSDRIVFVPLLGDSENPQNEDWESMEHVKAWGVFSETAYGDEFIVLRTEPVSEYIPPFMPCGLFEEEVACMRDIDPEDTTMPDELWARLAEYRLLGPVEPCGE